MRKKKKEFEPVGDHVSIYKNSHFWYINYIENGRQIRRSLKTKNKLDARKKAADIETQLCAGTGPTYTKPASVTNVIEAYLDRTQTDNLAPGTQLKYMGMLKTIARHSKRMNITNIAGLDMRFLDNYRKARADENRDPLTIHNETIMVLQLMNFAVSRKFLATNPLAEVKIRRPKPKEQPVWTESEITRIIERAEGISKICFQILSMTGMRIGELCYLEWTDINFEKRIIKIRPKDFEGTDKSGKSVKTHWQPKNGEERLVPMNSQLLELLQLLPHDSNWVITRPPRNGKNPRQLHGQWLLNVLQRILKKLGLDGHLHTFRHSFITIALVDKKIPADVVRKWVGHIDRRIIEKYTHVNDGISQNYMSLMCGGKSQNEDTDNRSEITQSDVA